MIYNLKLVYDYINGNDIDCNIEDLENNFNFMSLVIKYTKDKNMYNLCSLDLKNNFEFVKFLINMFNNDIDFIINISEKYLEQDNISDINRLELNILIRNSLKDDRLDKYINYMFNARMNYEIDMIDIYAFKDYSKENKELMNFVQKGFIIISDKYDGNETILNYYAAQFVLDLLGEEEIDLEIILHNTFDNINDIDNYGINKFLIELLCEYDSALAEYVATHLEILNILDEKIQLIKNRWDLFKEQNEYIKWDLLIDYYEKYININNLENTFNWKVLICYFVNKYKLKDIFLMSNILDENYYNIIIENYNINENKLLINELYHLKVLEKRFKKIINIKSKNVNEDLYDEDKCNIKCKVIKFDNYGNRGKKL